MLSHVVTCCHMLSHVVMTHLISNSWKHWDQRSSLKTPMSGASKSVGQYNRFRFTSIFLAPTKPPCPSSKSWFYPDPTGQRQLLDSGVRLLALSSGVVDVMDLVFFLHHNVPTSSFSPVFLRSWGIVTSKVGLPDFMGYDRFRKCRVIGI